MPVSYNSALKSVRMQAVIDAVDSHTPNPGVLEIGTVGMQVVLASMPLSLPSFTEANGTITLQGVPISADAVAAGTAAHADIKDGGGNVIVSGLSVGMNNSSDVILDSTSIIVGQTVTLTTVLIAHAL